MAHVPLRRYGPHRKRRVQKFFYCCSYIRCRGNFFFTEALPNSDRGIHKTHRLMGGIYEVRRWDAFRCHHIHSKFHKESFSHSKVDRVDTQTHRQHGVLINLLLFFQNK
jgi:hypothetical protein